MKTYSSEVTKMTSKFKKKFDALQKKFHSELRAESLKNQKIPTTADINLLWNKKYADKHAKLMDKLKNESITLWKAFNK